MTINQLSKQRKILRQALIDGGMFEGFMHLLTDMYPDNAHFIYELLQNAEDAGASEVWFDLKTDKLEVEHNGAKLFDIEDVESITNIGSSAKAEDPTSIGKFGIGFKAVFAYTNTPEIESDIFHFYIRDMVVPDTEGLPPGALGERRTRFVFPFDNPKKPPERAAAEIEKNLRELNENTLLFLSNICRIEYYLPDSTTGSLERKPVKNNGNRIKVTVKHPENTKLESTHYLRFTKDVNIKDEDAKFKHCRITVAFGMDRTKSGNWKVIPLNLGQVSIYFPAVKETSNLRFHIHAPFASTVARDSVRDCSANNELRDHIADLIAESMHAIRDEGLLDVKFLASLPNGNDNLSPYYNPIRKRLVEEFKRTELTPMKQGGHAPALECYRGPRRLSDLIKDKDLSTLLGKRHSRPLWIANPRQNNQQEDHFLSMLDISKWTIDEFIDILKDQPDLVTAWLKKKSNAWHQKLYAFLSDNAYRCSDLRVVRCRGGKYRVGNECHFPSSDTRLGGGGDGKFNYVVKVIYTSGKDKNQREKAREFLENVGVCEVNETELIKAILEHRYTDPDTAISSELHEKDMKRFIALVEDDSDNADLFEDYYIFKTADGYLTASDVFLDAPYFKTGLKACCRGKDPSYSVESPVNKRDSLLFLQDFSDKITCTKSKTQQTYFSLAYDGFDIDPKGLGKFAVAAGAKAKLQVVRDEYMRIWKDHPEWDSLKHGTGNWSELTGIDENYHVFEFQILLEKPSITKSKLIWYTMNSLPERYLKALFRWNQANLFHRVNSSLVHELRNAEWVPQKKANSKTSFVRPRDASINQLPAGFPYETGHKWLNAVEFGKKSEQRRLQSSVRRAEQREQNQHAKEMGFNSAAEANTMAEIASAWKEHGRSPEESLKKLLTQERRKELLIIDLGDAQEKSYEVRARSVKVTGNTIDPRTALRAQYTTDENRMYCQMCSKGMPFKKRNSEEDYFEAVEALGKGYFYKEHEAQYLALCPECAAKYKEFVKKNKKAREAVHNALKNSNNPHICLESSGETIHIRFEDKHWQDLKTVLYYYENVYNSEEDD